MTAPARTPIRWTKRARTIGKIALAATMLATWAGLLTLEYLTR